MEPKTKQKVVFFQTNVDMDWPTGAYAKELYKLKIGADLAKQVQELIDQGAKVVSMTPAQVGNASGATRALFVVLEVPCDC